VARDAFFPELHMSIHPFIQWFAGGETPYMRLSDCMMGDRFWIALTVVLDLSVAAGYVLIALHWWRNCKSMPATPARAALNNMRNIFVFCGICGYIFIPIKMIWPAWRLYDLFMILLVYYTWSYAWSARDLKVIYSELGRTNKLADDLERLREESRQKSIFLNSISHDLRTPLNGLMLQNNLARIALKQGDQATVGEALLEVESGIRATSDMLDRLLEYARLSATEEKNALALFRLDELVEQIFRTYRPAAHGKHLELISRVPADTFLYTDKIKLERILNNLVHNAIKFTIQGSVTIDAQLASNSAELHVTDTGVGIAREDLDKLFNEFFQAHNNERDRTKGFGLGLAIARRLSLQLGGDLTVESAPGDGTRFSILLPGVTVDPAQAAARTEGLPIQGAVAT
jgi:signal transduction histidine kinase